MRVLLSTLAMIANVVTLLLLALAVVGQTVLARSGERLPPGAAIVEAFIVGLVLLNIAAVLAGARAFRPKPATSDVVSTFN
jgi:uncharacterized membrane protein